MAFPALAYGVLHAKVIPTLGTDGNADLIFGVPLILKLVAAVIQPNANAADLLLHPVGRAAWAEARRIRRFVAGSDHERGP